MSEELNKKLIDTIIDENIEEKIKLNKVKNLVGSGADVNAKRDGRCVLSYVRLLGLNNKFEEFLKSSGAVEPNKLGLELMQAIANKDCNEVENLIANGADVNFDTKEFYTPLCYAIKTNSFNIVKTLIENGQIATQYVDLNGNATDDIQYNPNNSMWAIEGILSPDGRVIGKMGHSERIGDGLYKNVVGNYDMKLFRSAVKYYK